MKTGQLHIGLKWRHFTDIMANIICLTQYFGDKQVQHLLRSAQHILSLS